MAEVIGLTASLITLAGTGAKLAGTLFKVANIIRSAECEARVLAADIQIFSASLTQLSKVLELSHPATNQLRDITVVLINACQALNEELNIRIGDPLPYTSKRRFFTMEMLSLRFRWLIHGEKVAFLKSLIDSFKFTTLLLVSTMDLATALHRHAPESIAESFKSQVESNIGFAERATQDLFQNESAKQSPQTDEAPSSSLVELPQRLQIQSVRSEANDALVMHDFGFKGDGAQLDERAAIVATTSGSTQIEVSNNRDRDNVDDYQLQLSHECSQIFEIHRMTERLAREVLSQTMPRTTWSWSSPASTQQPTMPSAVPGQNMAVIDQVSLPTKRTEVLSERLGIGKPIFQSRTKDTSSSEPPPPEPSTVAADYLDARVDEVKSNVQGAASRGLTTAPPPTAEDDDDDDIDELKHPSTVSTATASSSVIVEEFEDHGRYTEEVTKSSFQPGDQGRQLPNSDWLWHRKESRNRSPLDESRSFGSSWDQLPREDSKTIPTTPPMPPPQGSAEQAILEKLASMLSTEEKRRAQEADIARQKAENEKFSRLENLLIAQQTARIEKEQAKKEAAEMAALKAAEAKRKGDEDKLAKLEELILAQKEEQLKREAAIEAAARAEKAERDAKLAREAAEKKVAAEQAAKLLEAAKRAREEAETKAVREAEETKAAHEKALREALEATQELAKAKQEAERAADALPPIQFEDAAGRRFLCLWKVGHSWQGMQQFIEQVSAGVDKMTQLVESGQYDLVKDGLTIPPQQWEALVRPGASIKMCDRAEKVLPSTSKSRLPISVDAAKPSRKISWLRKSSAKTVDQKESVLKKRESSSSERFPDIPTTHSSTEKVDQGARGRIAGSSSNADGDGPGAF